MRLMCWQPQESPRICRRLAVKKHLHAKIPRPTAVNRCFPTSSRRAYLGRVNFQSIDCPQKGIPSASNEPHSRTASFTSCSTSCFTLLLQLRCRPLIPVACLQRCNRPRCPCFAMVDSRSTTPALRDGNPLRATHQSGAFLSNCLPSYPTKRLLLTFDRDCYSICKVGDQLAMCRRVHSPRSQRFKQS